MIRPEELQSVFSQYTDTLDTALQAVFESAPKLPMYDHLAYFMGFKNQELQPEITYGGKRFRSGLMLMLGDWYGFHERTLPMATALELYHNYTLIHDDIEDRDTMRRGRPTLWVLFGINNAINDGDQQMFMVAEMLAKAATRDNASQQAQLLLLKQFRLVIEGQYLDFALTDKKLGEAGVDEEAYLEMIRCKTAELIVAATRGAGVLSERPEAELAELETFGRELGMAYQICDDVVSAWATTNKTGKENYGDIKERKKTLPVLFAYNALAAGDQKTLETYFAKTERLSDAEAEAVLTLIDSVGTYEAMREVIEERAAAAKAAAAKLSLDGKQKEALITIVDALLPKVK